MNVSPTDLSGVLLVDPKVHGDDRGFFVETYHADRYREAGIPDTFVQDNHSRSARGTLRGLHAQLTHPQAKLVRAIEGAILDVVVDIRPSSRTFGRWLSVELSAENFRQIYVPVGFAHGFCVLSDSAQVEYKCSDIYDPSHELCLIWNDPAVGVEWPVGNPTLSEKDRAGKPLAAWKGVLEELWTSVP